MKLDLSDGVMIGVDPLASVLNDLMATVRDGKATTDLQRVSAVKRLVEMGKMPTFVPLLPLLLNLNGTPYTLEDHFPFEPIFQCHLPRELLLKTGRQVSKSTSVASRGVILSWSIPHFSTLFITPLYEQIRRFSTNYVRPFIDQSPLKTMLCGTGTENSVLQRSFKNFSKMYFSFALTDANRVRGISAHACNFDEIQDMDQDLIPIIQETMSHSDWRLSMYTGTPKTLDNAIEGKWTDSSQAEWCITCPSCRYLNVPKMNYDLEKMIGPWHDGIGVLNPTPEQIKKKIKGGVPATICAKCQHWVDPRTGRWIHAKPQKRWSFPGYHVPQVIMPIHYQDPDRWAELLAKQQGYGNFTVPQFYNEVLGESYDVGAKLVTETDLIAAAVLPYENNPVSPTVPLQQKREYVMRVMGVDWGGGGENEISFTVMTIIGLRADGKLDIIYGRRLLTPHDHMEEARQIMKVFNAFDCSHLAHDYNGAGSLRETFMIQAGLQYSKICPIVYTRSASKDIMTYHKSQHEHHRDYWLLDKARSLQLVCQCFKLKWLRSFKYDKVSKDNPGLLCDFLSLTENKVEMPRGPDIYMIQRSPHSPDDFAHAVTYGCAIVWHVSQSWPNLAMIAKMQLSQEQMSMVSPDKPWIRPDDIK
jgi:hypothetical protein